MIAPFDRSRPTLVVLSQVYVPDPAAVGQHMHDVAAEMTRRGWQVLVLTADRGYEDPTQRYLSREILEGVHVVRLPWSNFGKTSIAARLAGGGVFLAEAVPVALMLPRIDHVLVSTSPPMCSLAGVALRKLRRPRVTFWAMDINPDQSVAVGAIAPGSIPVKAFDWINRQILHDADHIVALDRFMADRLRTKETIDNRLTVIPPWPPVQAISEDLPHAENSFRHEHGLSGKRVVMYSGNLSPSHPVTTILDAARALEHRDEFVFLFIGGGLGRKEIEDYRDRHHLKNVRTLPYQPRETLPHSLGAADIHLVAMGTAMVGIVHPSKIYGAIAVGRAILVLGPRQSHAADVVITNHLGWQVDHGNVAGVVEILENLSDNELAEMGRRARAISQKLYSRDLLLGRFCDVIEGRQQPEPHQTAIRQSRTITG